MAILRLKALRYPNQGTELASASFENVDFDSAEMILPTLQAASVSGLGGSVFLYNSKNQIWRCRVLNTVANINTALAAIVSNNSGASAPRQCMLTSFGMTRQTTF